MINQTFITGNLVHDPQSKELPSGSKVCNFRLANSRKYTDNTGNSREETLFIGVQVFGKSATHCQQFLRKGSQVLVQGRLQFKEYQAKDGSKRSEISILADTVQFLDGKPQQQNNRLPDNCRNDYASQGQAPAQYPQHGNYSSTPMPGEPHSPYSAADRPAPRPQNNEDGIPF